MDALLSLLRLEDTDTVVNVLWALRHLVSEGLQRDTVIRATATASLKPLMESADERIVTSVEALQDVLRRPVPIQTDTSNSDEDEQAAVGLASILNTPPPSSSQASPDSAAEANGAEQVVSSSSRRKHRLVEPVEEPVEEPQLRRSKRSRRSRLHGDEEEAKEEEAVQAQGEEGEAAEGESAEAALAFLIQAAEG